MSSFPTILTFAAIAEQVFRQVPYVFYVKVPDEGGLEAQCEDDTGANDVADAPEGIVIPYFRLWVVYYFKWLLIWIVG